MKINKTKLTPSFIAFSLVTALLAGCSKNAKVEPTATASPAPTVSMEFIGETFIPHGMDVEGTTLLGLSTLTRVKDSNTYYAICDDTSEAGKARFYSLDINLGEDEKLNEGDVTVNGVVFLKDKQGDFTPKTFDLEGIALDADGKTLLFASEGVGDGPDGAHAPFVKRSMIDGQYVGEIAIDLAKLDQTQKAKHGVYNSGGFESLVYSMDHQTLWMAPETALQQDSDQSTLTASSPARLMKYDASNPDRIVQVAEYVYQVEPRVGPAEIADQGGARSLVDILPLDGGKHLLVLEREWIKGEPRTNTRPVALYLADLREADDVMANNPLKGTEKAVKKTLILDFDTLRKEGKVARVGSFEAMVFGPKLKDGRQTLIFVEDNDGSVDSQIIAFAVKITS